MKLASFLAIALGALMSFVVADLFAGDVYVDGYYRKDGTYVRPHIRSSPNQFKWDNYGPSRNSSELLNPRARDYDRDGLPNYLDRDDDNDFKLDGFDSNQYGSSGRSRSGSGSSLHNLGSGYGLDDY